MDNIEQLDGRVGVVTYKKNLQETRIFGVIEVEDGPAGKTAVWRLGCPAVELPAIPAIGPTGFTGVDGVQILDITLDNWMSRNYLYCIFCEAVLQREMPALQKLGFMTGALWLQESGFFTPEYFRPPFRVESPKIFDIVTTAAETVAVFVHDIREMERAQRGAVLQ